MKKIIAVFTFCFLSTIIFSQQIEISEAPRVKEDGMYNSYLFEMSELDSKSVEKEWEKFIKDFKAKTKYSKKTKTHTSENAIIPQLSDGTVNISARIMENKNSQKSTSVIVWFKVGEEYITSETSLEKGNYAKSILTEFAITTSKHHAEDEVKNEEKSLAKMEKELSKLKKNNKDYNKTIEKAKTTISKNEKNIEINELDQKKKVQEIEDQKVAVELAKEGVKKFKN